MRPGTGAVSHMKLGEGSLSQSHPVSGAFMVHSESGRGRRRQLRVSAASVPISSPSLFVYVLTFLI